MAMETPIWPQVQASMACWPKNHPLNGAQDLGGSGRTDGFSDHGEVRLFKCQTCRFIPDSGGYEYMICVVIKQSIS